MIGNKPLTAIEIMEIRLKARLDLEDKFEAYLFKTGREYVTKVMEMVEEDEKQRS